MAAQLMTAIDATGRASREINAELRQQIAGGATEITIHNPGARHNLAVAVLQPVRIRIEGSVGYYCGGLGDGARIEIAGSSGWGLAESMLNGEVRVHGSGGSGTAAALRGGTVVIHGDAGARLGVSMKGGVVIVGGDCGYMAGFMGQKGKLIVCGNAGEAFGDSMYTTECYVGGEIASLGTDAVIAPMTDQDATELASLLQTHLGADRIATLPAARDFKKVVSGRKLWNFDKRERLWQEAL